MFLQKVSYHPVHILNTAGEFSPSSFIPFCSFGEEFVGIKINEFDIPVCDVFKPKLYFDQLCYETDLQQLKDTRKLELEKQLKYGLTLVLDYNEERQVNINTTTRNKFDEKKRIYHDNANSFSMFVDTISDTFNGFCMVFNVKLFRSSRDF